MINSDVSLLHIQGYSIAAYSARQSRHGGTCIMIRHGLKFKELDTVAKYSAPNIVEMCGVELVDIIIICVYRSPRNKDVKSKYVFFLIIYKMFFITTVLK